MASSKAEDFDDGDGETELSGFYRADEFFPVLKAFLDDPLDQTPYIAAYEDEEGPRFTRYYFLLHLLEVYQGQSYLLDPYLESIVPPLVHCLRIQVQKATPYEDTPEKHADLERLHRLCGLAYFVSKIRGEKTIVRFFPHEVQDLALLLTVFSGSIPKEKRHWQLEYTLLLWLSLVCTVPFGLHNFDGLPAMKGIPTAEVLEKIAGDHLGASSKDRDGAVMVLGRLYSRQDVAVPRLIAFIEGLKIRIENDSDDILATGVVRTLCEIIKSCPPKILMPASHLLYNILALYDTSLTGPKNIVVRKYKTKLSGRLALLFLPRRTKGRAKKGRHAFQAESVESEGEDEDEDDEDFEMDPKVEAIVQDLLEGLQDRDTIVRYSSSKYLSRIAERLPNWFSQQLVDAIIAQFSVGAVKASDGELDPFTISDGTWHGCCLALAEFARRGQLDPQNLQEVTEWVLKALRFDYKRGSQAIGSGVRDAAAYVVWSFGRAYDPPELEPHALKIARALITVACYDREVHVRRAASAAFQENAGRLGLFPDGIDIIQKMDSFSVSLRRKAFLSAAPSVAMHSAYRLALVDDLLHRALIHYDADVRELASVSLGDIAAMDDDVLNQSIGDLKGGLTSKENHRLHGSMLGLAQLARACGNKQDKFQTRKEIFASLDQIPDTYLKGYTAAPLLAAACEAVRYSFASADLVSTARWWEIITLSLQNSDEKCHTAAANALEQVSCLSSCDEPTNKVLEMLSRSGTSIQASAALVLGQLDYQGSCRAHLDRVWDSLLNTVKDETSAKRRPIVEARRNACSALASIVIRLGPVITSCDPDFGSRTFECLLSGLDDYTTDQRGDVGSWVRSACIESLGSMVAFLISTFTQNTTGTLSKWLSQETFDKVMAKLLKHSLERIDTLRVVAGGSLKKVVLAVDSQTFLKIHGLDQVHEALEGEFSWRDATESFQQLLPLLVIPEYRPSLLEGAVTGLATKTEVASGPAATAFVDYISTLSPTTDEPDKEYSLLQLSKDLNSLVRKHFTATRIFNAIFQAIGLLLEAELLDSIDDGEEGTKTLKLLCQVGARSLSNIKSLQRIQIIAKSVIGLIRIPGCRKQALKPLKELLIHNTPVIRSGVAEDLFLVLQGLGDIPQDVEDALLNTSWIRLVDHTESAEKVVTGIEKMEL